MLQSHLNTIKLKYTFKLIIFMPTIILYAFNGIFTVLNLYTKLKV